MTRSIFLKLGSFSMMFIMLLGCTPIDPDPRKALAQPDSGFVLLIILHPDMFDRAHEFAMHSLERYYDDRIGNENDQVIIAQVAETQNSLLWQGTPQDLRDTYPTPEAFKAMLLKASGNIRRGFKVHDGIARAMKYIMRHRSVASHTAQSAVLVLSDLTDKGDDPTSEKRLLDAFVKYVENYEGLVGFYYLSQEMYFHWGDLFEEVGLGWIPIECDIHGKPKLPNFEDINKGFK